MNLRAVPFLVASAAVLSAQSTTLVPPAARPEVRWLDASAPTLRVVYDAHAQRIRSVTPRSPDRIDLTSPPCFDNSQPTLPPTFGFFPYVVSNVGEELVAWGTKQCRESSLLRSFTVRYGSTAYSPASGGPGAAMSLALFEGTRGFGRLGNEIFRHTITGLPGGALVELTVDFGDAPIRLRDGNIGWSILQIDGLSGPILVRAPRAILGTSDALDLYSPGPAVEDAYVGTFNYGGCQGEYEVCANLFIQLDEIPDEQLATSTVVNGTGVNPLLLSEILPARIGETWVARVDITGQPPGSSTLLVLSGATAPPIAHPFGEFLLDPTRIFGAPVPGVGGYAFAIPPDTSLAGVRFSTQGVLLPAGLRPVLTNALRVQVGY
jgi:hypothetical protein